MNDQRCPRDGGHPEGYETHVVTTLGERRREHLCGFCGHRWPGEYVSAEAEVADAVEEARRVLGEGD